MSAHYDIICKECKKRIGGCRCIGEPRKVHEEGPCEECKAKHAGKVPSPSHPPVPAGDGVDLEARLADDIRMVENQIYPYRSQIPATVESWERLAARLRTPAPGTDELERARKACTRYKGDLETVIRELENDLAIAEAAPGTGLYTRKECPECKNWGNDCIGALPCPHCSGGYIYTEVAAPGAPIEAAAREFARAWAAWHDHSGLMLDDDLITASNGILEALGVELVEGEDGKHTCAAVDGSGLPQESGGSGPLAFRTFDELARFSFPKSTLEIRLVPAQEPAAGEGGADRHAPTCYSQRKCFDSSDDETTMAVCNCGYKHRAKARQEGAQDPKEGGQP